LQTTNNGAGGLYQLPGRQISSEARDMVRKDRAEWRVWKGTTYLVSARNKMGDTQKNKEL